MIQTGNGIFSPNSRPLINNHLLCVCMFIPSPVKVGTLLSEVPGTPIGASFFEFELKLTGKNDDTIDQPSNHFVRQIRLF